MSADKLNTVALQQFMNQVRGAETSNQREIRIDIATAKTLSYTIGLAMTRLAGNYEGLMQAQAKEDPVITVQMDGGTWTK